MSPKTYSKPKVKVGASWQKQYISGAKKHIVELDNHDTYRTICTNGKATFEYSGFLQAVTCDRCVAVWARDEHGLRVERSEDE